jgi:LmbE family N-acetylglucosaminyl deacetylase
MDVVILLPHMDDEVFIIPYLVKLREQKSSDVSIYFLTKSEGRENRFDQNVREQESIRAIAKILPDAAVHFLGRKFDVKDLDLHKNLLVHFEYLKTLLANNSKTIVSPHFEGGHIDHDSSCILAFELAKSLGCRHLTFNIYSARAKSGPFYKVAKPIEKLSPRFKVPIGAAVYAHTLLIPARYRSQLLTWLGLYLALVWRTLVMRKFSLFTDVAFNPNEMPNFGKVLYENRGDGSYLHWNTSVNDFLKTINLGGIDG